MKVNDFYGDNDHETLRIVYSKKLNGVNIASLKLTKTVTSYGYLKKIGANKNRFTAK